MAGAFSALQKVMRVNGIDAPEFLRTHPLDTNRIAEAGRLMGVTVIDHVIISSSGHVSLRAKGLI